VTTLSDAAIERYSRQIIVPEIGARGQLRLLDARVLVAGTGDAVAAVVTLLARAGVGTLLALDGPVLTEPPGPDARLAAVAGDDGSADVVVDFAARGAALARRGRPHVLAALAGDVTVVATLVGRPCAACAGIRGAAPAPGPAAAVALGAVAAAEVLRVLVAMPATGRLQRLAADAGGLAAGALPPAVPCAVCG